MSSFRKEEVKKIIWGFIHGYLYTQTELRKFLFFFFFCCIPVNHNTVVAKQKKKIKPERIFCR